jgi:phage baseplate assembly protein W
MARTIYQYQTINTMPDKSIGITLPFNKGANSRSTSLSGYDASVSGKGVFNQSYSTEEQSISNLKNLLLTVKGERVMQPNFGTSLQRLIFEQNVDDLSGTIENELTDSINFWLPYIVIQNIDILQIQDSYSILVRLYFSVTEVGANQVINILANENSLQLVNTPTVTQLTAIS